MKTANKNTVFAAQYIYGSFQKKKKAKMIYMFHCFYTFNNFYYMQ